MGDAQYINKDLISYCSSDLDQAMIYRLEFASDERRDYFESRIDALSTVIDASMIGFAVSWVREYPGERKALLRHYPAGLRWVCREEAA